MSDNNADDAVDLNTSLSFVAEDEDMPYERAVRLDHQNTVTSVLAQATELQDALKAQCAYDGPLTVSERRAIRHNKKVLLTIQRQLEEAMQKIKPMPVSNPSSRHTSFEQVHAQSANEFNQQQCTRVKEETDTITDECKKRQMHHSEHRVERVYNRGSVNRGSSRGRARGRPIQHDLVHDQPGFRFPFSNEQPASPLPAARSRIRKSELSENAASESSIREMQEDAKSFTSSPETPQESQTSVTSKRSNSKSGIGPRAAMTGIKERISRDKEKIKMRQKEEKDPSLPSLLSKRNNKSESSGGKPRLKKMQDTLDDVRPVEESEDSDENLEQVVDYTSNEEEEKILPKPEELSHGHDRTAESDSYELPTVEDYLGTAEKEPSPISYVAEEEISSQSTLDQSQIDKSDEEVTEKASENTPSTEKDEEQKSQINSYMSDLRKKESHLRYAENGSDVEKSPDEERMQEIKAISDVGRLSQPGRSSEDEDSDEEFKETSSLINGEGILGSHMKYIGTSSLLQSTSSNLKSSSRLSSKTREEEREKRRSDLKRRKEKQRDESSRVESVKSTNLSSRDRDSRLSSKRDEEEKNHSKISVRSSESLRGQHASRGRGRGIAPVAQSRTTTETSDGQLYGRADPPPSRRQPVDYDQYRRRREEPKPPREELHWPKALTKCDGDAVTFRDPRIRPEVIQNNHTRNVPAYEEDDSDDFEKQIEEFEKMTERGDFGPSNFLYIKGGERATANRIPIKITEIVHGVGLFIVQLQRPLFDRRNSSVKAMMAFIKNELPKIQHHQHLIVPREDIDHGLFVFARNPKMSPGWVRGKVVNVEDHLIYVLDVDNGVIFNPIEPLYLWSEESVNLAFPDSPGAHNLFLPELTLACRLAVLADTDLPRPVIPKDNRDYFSQFEIESFKNFVKKMDMEGTKFEMAPCESRKHGKVFQVVLFCADQAFEDEMTKWGQEVFPRLDMPLPAFRKSEDGSLIHRNQLTRKDLFMRAVVGCEEMEGIRPLHESGRYV